MCANVTGAPLEYGWKEMKSFSEVLDEEPWTKAKEAAALEEMRKKMEARHIQKKAENGDDGEAKVVRTMATTITMPTPKRPNNRGKEAAVGPSCTLRSKFEALNLITMK